MTVSSSPNGASAAGRHAAPAAPAAVAAADAGPSVGQLVSEASTHLSTLVRSEIELAKLELRSSVKNAGVGIGFFGAAAAVLVFSLVFGFITLAEGLAALGLDRWLAFLIVFVFQLLLAGVAAFLGYKKVKRVKAPQRTIATSKESVAYLQSNIHPR
ncbi:MAG: phage holin family protein [Jatrophihabitans sp.]|uniref:phage holin family protein n=1 Tax=Jatrophihabitans sp. TaxID=1932789 RepID=UPI003F7E8512